MQGPPQPQYPQYSQPAGVAPPSQYPPAGYPGGYAPPPGGGGGRKPPYLIVGGVVGLALIGVVAWLLVGGKKTEPPQTLPTPGRSATPTLSPSAVPSVGSPTSPPSPSPTLSPSPAFTTPPATLTPSPIGSTAPPTPDAHTVVVGDVSIPVPDGWTATQQSAFAGGMYRQNPYESLFFNVYSPESGASTQAANEAQRVAAVWVSAQNGYSQIQFGDPASLDPRGAILSLAYVAYRGVWTGDQGSVQLEGLVFCAVRQDGEVLVMSVELVQGTFDATKAEWSPIIDGVINSFAGIA